MSKSIDLTGQKFGRLIVMERIPNRKGGRIQWLCVCDCGTQKIIIGKNLKNNNTKSCGCLKDYPRYGSRGITVCKRWMKFLDFFRRYG